MERKYLEEISENGYQKENRDFPIWFPSKKTSKVKFSILAKFS